MSRDPYTYVTVSIDSDEAPRVGVSFYTPGLRVSAGVLDSGRPYLDVSSKTADVSISTTGAGAVTSTDLEIARQIFTAAARYLADCERLHADQLATPDLSGRSDRRAQATGTAA
ncbi:hypothetical protein [Sphaerimonospora mesophila]|uniref:hypothetical protein n=1 Tax=Sphaerimonospora mesophila TaxID=37483 RepID=UPI0006E1426F